MTVKPVIRPLGQNEIVKLVDWARDEGWNPGIDDAACFRAADPEGFIGCFVDGVMVSAIAAVRYGEEFGFIGLYICDPAWRGRGYGRWAWDAGMEHLAGRVTGLDGVAEQQENYARMGFSHAYRTVRWCGRAPEVPVMAPDVGDAVPGDFDRIEQFDRQFFPAPRSLFLRSWLMPPRIGLVAQIEGEIAGYAVVRDCVEGAKIGPLFAEDEETAKRLLTACLSRRPGQSVSIDMPEHQRGFAEVLEKLDMQPGFTTARMYRGAPPPVSLPGIFAITTLELG